MPTIHLDLYGVARWDDLAGHHDRVLHAGTDWKLAAIPGAMSSGGVSLALRLDYPQGDADGTTTVITEMTLATWIAATCALRGRYPEAFAGTPLAEAP